jgi:hypothetical protein
MSFPISIPITDINQINPKEVFANWPTDCLTASNKIILSHRITFLFQMVNPGERLTPVDRDEKTSRIKGVAKTTFSDSCYYEENSDPRSLPSNAEECRIYIINKMRKKLEEEADINEYEKQELENTISTLESGSQDKINAIINKVPIKELMEEGLISLMENIRNNLTRKPTPTDLKIEQVVINLKFKILDSDDSYEEKITWSNPELVSR